MLDHHRRQLDQLAEAQLRAVQNRLVAHQQRLVLLGHRLPPPQQQWQVAKTRLDYLAAGGDRALLVWRDKVAAALRHHGERVATLGERLERGFDLRRVWLRPLVLDRDGTEVLAAAGQRVGQSLTLVFRDGKIVTEVKGEGEGKG